MKKLQFSIALLIVWLIFLFNIERVNHLVNIRSYTYIFVALIAIIVVALPGLSNRIFWLLLVVLVPIYFVVRALNESGSWEKNLVEDYALPITIIQVGAIVLTGIFARQISYQLVEFNQIVHNLTFGRIGMPPPRFSEEQGVMYNEVKRARRFERPLTVLAIKVDREAIQGALPKMLEEVQQTTMQEYVYAGMARILDDNLLEHDIIVRRNDHFVVLLPETTVETTPTVINKITQAIEQKMNVRLQAGAANFPNDAITFEQLIDLAVQNAGKTNDNEEQAVVQSM